MMVSIHYHFVLNKYIVLYIKYDQILHFCILYIYNFCGNVSPILSELANFTPILNETISLISLT